MNNNEFKTEGSQLSYLCPKFSVLMSIYIKEKVEYVRECFESLLNQTVKANEWVIVEDGPLSQEMYDLLDDYQNRYPELIKRVPLKENKGLGLALREGILNCSHELIARMDTDDIALPQRFEIQLQQFIQDENLDICGSHIIEFEGTTDNILSKRHVPLSNEGIYNYQRKRCAFNHMTVMYKKSTVLKVGNYEHAPLMEDDMLWTRMILAKCQCKNIDDYLVYARIGLDMISRRGGYSYYKKYKDSRKKVYQLGLCSYWDYLYTLIVQLIVCMVPGKIREFIFINLLHKK